MEPQLIFIILMILDLGIAIGKHGEEREPHHAGLTFISWLIIVVILYWGGFFDNLLNVM